MPGSGWRWPWRRNLLRRGSDLLEAWLYLVTVLVIVLIAPALGTLAGLTVYDTLRDDAARQARERHRTTATLLPEPTPSHPPPKSPRHPGEPRDHVPARMHWTAPDGSERSDTAGSVPRERIGSVNEVWTDATGRLVGAPLNGEQARGRAIAGGAAAASGVIAVQLAAQYGVVRVLERRRLRGWQRAWARIGPRWSRRRG